MLKWLLAGVGDIARKRVLPAILSESRSQLVGLVTRDLTKAEAYKVPAWTDFEEALTKSGADAVYIATPVALHAPQTIAALRAGMHVLCEKPMALNYPEAQSMVAEAKNCGRTFGVAYYRRMYPKIQRARELLTTGAIGTPVLAEASAHDWFHPTDDFRAWLVDPALAGGGPLYDIASHRIDLFNYLFGQPGRATGQLSTAVHRTSVEDNATVLIEYAGGVRGVVDVRWHSRILRDEFRIRGTEGEMDLSPLNGPLLTHPGGEMLLPMHRNLHYPCVENFVGAVVAGTPLQSTGATALWTDWVTAEVLKANT